MAGAVEAVALAAVIGFGSFMDADAATVAVLVVASGTVFATFGQLADALAAWAYIRRHLDLVDDLAPGAVGSSSSGGVSLTGVGFGHPDQPGLLSDVSLVLPAGSRPSARRGRAGRRWRN